MIILYVGLTIFILFIFLDLYVYHMSIKWYRKLLNETYFDAPVEGDSFFIYTWTIPSGNVHMETNGEVCAFYKNRCVIRGFKGFIIPRYYQYKLQKRLKTVIQLLGTKKAA